MANPDPTFLAHCAGDAVGVAVVDAVPGTGHVGYLDGTASAVVEVASEIPLGHKVALSNVGRGDDVVEYGIRIGIATADITEGDYVHIHNVRSARWQNSVA